jgi:hypothetical protein
VYNKTVPDDDFIKSKHVVIETQVFLLVVLTDKIKSSFIGDVSMTASSMSGR